MSSPLVRHHEFVVVCEFNCAEADPIGGLRRLKLGALVSGPLAHAPGISDAQAAEAAVFEAFEQPLADDLHPAAAAALGLDGTKWQTGRRLRMLHLSSRARQVINGGARWAGFRKSEPSAEGSGAPRQPGRHIEVHLPRAAPVLIEVADIRILDLGSRTGLAFAHLRLCEDEPSLEAVQAVLKALTPHGREGALRWPALPPSPADSAPGQASDAPAADPFSLVELLSCVLAPAACGFEAWSRLYTHSFIQLPADTTDEALMDAAWRLSRHYDRSYAAMAGWPDSEMYRPFADVVHALSLEGAAFAVREGSSFIAGGGPRRSFGTGYLFLAALAYHEQSHLLDIAQKVGSLALSGDSARDQAALRALLDGFLRFRLRHVVPMASDVTMHNEVYWRMRRALRLEALETKVTQHIAAAESHLRILAAEEATRRAEAQEDAFRQRERRRAVTLAFFSGLLTLLTVNTLLREGLKLLLETDKPPSGWQWAAVGVALLAALWAGIDTWLRHKDEHRPHAAEGGHVAKHLEEERRTEAVLSAAKVSSAATAARSST